MDRDYDPNDPEEVRMVLRHEILAARLKVTLDRKRGVETSELVKALAGMELP